MARKILVVAAVTAFGLTASAVAISRGATPRMLGPGYTVQVNPADFGTTIDNPWFPLKPGTSFVYSTAKGRPPTDVMTVSRRTRVLDGVTTVVVFDRTYEDGRLAEKTADYYAQKNDGSVWYFGEDAYDANKKGKLILSSDSWHSGVDGALPGDFMPAAPQLGEEHYQEYYVGHAEDQYAIASLTARVEVPFGSFKGTLQTNETSRLEPGVLDRDYYVRGVGQVLEKPGAGGRTALIRIQHRRWRS
jgi:hypothetical protein